MIQALVLVEMRLLVQAQAKKRGQKKRWSFSALVFCWCLFGAFCKQNRTLTGLLFRHGFDEGTLPVVPQALHGLGFFFLFVRVEQGNVFAKQFAQIGFVVCRDGRDFDFRAFGQTAFECDCCVVFW